MRPSWAQPVLQGCSHVFGTGWLISVLDRSCGNHLTADFKVYSQPKVDVWLCSYFSFPPEFLLVSDQIFLHVTSVKCVFIALVSCFPSFCHFAELAAALCYFFPLDLSD